MDKIENPVCYARSLDMRGNKLFFVLSWGATHVVRIRGETKCSLFFRKVLRTHIEHAIPSPEGEG